MRHATTTSLALLLLALAACGTGAKPPAAPEGTVFRLNPERWAATEGTAR